MYESDTCQMYIPSYNIYYCAEIYNSLVYDALQCLLLMTLQESTCINFVGSAALTLCVSEAE